MTADYTDSAIAGTVVAVVSFCVQFGMFVRPEQLEKKHREILEDAEKRFASVQMVCDLKARFEEVKSRLDEIYNMLLEKR